MKAMHGDSEQWVIIDLDGTLCDSEHRAPLARAKQWDAFHALLMKDRPVYAVLAVLRAMRMTSRRIGIATGRPERYRKATCEWLEYYGIHIDDLQMRRDNDFRSDILVKSEMFVNRFIVFVLEDRARVVEMWRARGEVCFGVVKGDY